MLETLDGLLTRFHPTVGGQVAHAAVRRMLMGPDTTPTMLAALPDPVQTSDQPALVLRAYCLRDLGAADHRQAARAARLATPDQKINAYRVQEFGEPPDS